MIPLSLFLLGTAQGFKIHCTAQTYGLQFKLLLGTLRYIYCTALFVPTMVLMEMGVSVLCYAVRKTKASLFDGWACGRNTLRTDLRVGRLGHMVLIHTSNLAFWKNCNVFTSSAVCDWSDARGPTA